MNNYFPPFPTLCPGTLNAKALYEFSFWNKDLQQWNELEAEFDNDTELHFSSKIWNAADFNLKIKISLQLSKAKNLFSGANAVAEENAQIGVAVRWRIPGMAERQTSVFTNFLLDKNTDNADGQLELTFPSHYLRNGLAWEVTLFLKTSGTSGSVFAQVPGSLLGIIDQKNISTGGVKGIFNTIWENAGENNPLWRVKLDFSSFDEPFCPEAIALYLNRDHCGSSLIAADDKKISPMLFEIFSNVCFLLLRTAVKRDGFELIADNITTISTFSDYLNVMLQQLFPEWGRNELNEEDYILMEKIRKTLSQRINISDKQPKEGNDE